MSNTNDPKQPTPEQPDPNAPAAPEGGYRSGGSSFEFQLPDEVGSFSELPPIPDPDAGDSGTLSALPPKPDAAPPVKGTFDFVTIPGSRGSFGDFGMDPQPVEGELVPTDDALIIPDLPAMPGPGDSAILFESPLPPVEPASATLHIEPLEPSTDLADVTGPASGFLPDIPVALADDALADIDLADLAPASGVNLAEPPKVSASDSSVGFGSPLPVPDEELPLAAPASSFTLGSGKAASDSGSVPDLAAYLPLPVPDAPSGDSSISLDVVEATAAPSSVTLGDDLPVAEPASSFTLGGGAKPGSSGSVPDVGTLFPATPVADAPVADAAPSSGSTPSLPDTPAVPHGASSFEFQLPDGVNSISELPPIPEPDANDSSPNVALPPTPVAHPVGSTSFDFINVGPRSFGDFGMEPQPIDAGEPPPAEASSPRDLSPVPDSKVGLGNAVPVDAVEPVSGWLDSGVIAAEPVPVADVFDAPVADLIESSDIFAGGPVPAAERVDNSDVLEVSSGFAPAAGPVDSVRPSEVALTFNDPPGGSTVDGDISDLPVADELEGSSTTLLGSPGRDAESIHDAAEVVSDNPLFDSANLADAPDLPAGRAKSSDAADYGAAPGYTSDASSILGDLGGPHDPSDADSSSVRVEAPGLDRTLTGGPSDGAFDLTVAEEPVPDGLFDEPAEATEWQTPSGSNLLADGDTTGEVDLDAEAELADVEFADAEPVDEATGLPSSIFTGSPPAGASARIGGRAASDEPTGDLTDAVADEAVEFTDYPEFGATVERGALPPASDKRITGLSSAEFEVPAVPAAQQPDDGGAFDWDAQPMAEGDDATRGMPQDASLSAILRGELPDDSDELPTKSTRPLTPAPADADEEPVVTVDWMSGSAEGSAVAEPVETFPTAPPAPLPKKGKPRARATRAPTRKRRRSRPSRRSRRAGAIPVRAPAPRPPSGRRSPSGRAGPGFSAA